MNFEILKKSKRSNARLGLLQTSHGVVETPCLVGVATQATIKTLTAEEVERAGSQILISNTFHLHIKPGEKFLKKAGGIHKFMNWKRPLMTDSGGFQVFSLGFGRDHGVGKILKHQKDLTVELGHQPKNIKITQDGVYFNSPVDGRKLFIGPKESMRIQSAIGADIIFTFDEPTSPVADHAYTKKSLEKTHQWAKLCLKYRNPKQALFGIVQGGKFKDLRIESAKFIGSLPFDGFGIGGEYGDDKRKMPEMLGWVVDNLPEKKPRHLLGVGHLEDMEAMIKCGVDTFDCIAPTHYARRGVAFTSEGRLNMRQRKFLHKNESLDKKCTCEICKNYTKAYICHLLRAGEITALRLITFHNLYYFNNYVAKIREKIKKGEI